MAEEGGTDIPTAEERERSYEVWLIDRLSFHPEEMESVDGLAQHHFVDSWCGKVYQIMRNLYDAQGIYSPTELCNALADSELDRAELEQLWNPIGNPFKADELAGSIKRYYDQGKWREEITNVLSTAKTPDECRERLLQHLRHEAPSDTEYYTLGHAYDAIMEAQTHDWDFRWGLAEIDELTCGIRKGLVYVLAGKTGHGKTTFACNVTRNALCQDKRVLYVAFENPTAIWSRLIAVQSKVPAKWYWRKSGLGEKRNDFDDAKAVLQGMESRLRVCGPMSVTQIIKEARRFKPDILIVDYLQILAAYMDTGKRKDTLSWIIGQHLGRLASFVVEADIALLVLSQVKRLRGKPTISDLKESGDIENHADVVGIVWWGWKESKEGNTQNDYQIEIVKNRLGEDGTVRLRFDPTTFRITAPAKDDEERMNHDESSHY